MQGIHRTPVGIEHCKIIKRDTERLRNKRLQIGRTHIILAKRQIFLFVDKRIAFEIAVLIIQHHI